MEPSRIQLSLTGMLALVACIALNIWLFRVGMLWGIIGLNVTKHVVIAQLCHAVGVNRSSAKEEAAALPAAQPVAIRREPSSN